MLKREKAITLIALVVTIVVLLILAAITINLVLSEGGLFERAQGASDAQKLGEVKETVSIMLSDYIVEKYINNKNLETYLNEQKNAGKLDEVINNGDGTITVELNGYEVTIDEETLEIIDTQKNGKSVRIKLSKEKVQPGEEVKATVTFGEEIEIGSCKYKITTSSELIGTEEGSYTKNITENPTTIDLTTETEGTYYVHVLVVDKDGNINEKVSKSVTVSKEILITELTLDKTTAKMLAGNTITLTASIEPETATNKKLTWESSNTEVATVNNGVVTAIANTEGETTITVATNDGSNLSATCKVTVINATSVASLVGKEASNENIVAADEYLNLITIPAGFTVVEHSEGNSSTDVTYGYTGDTSSPAVQDGIVIEDSDGNQFVWVPVGTINNKADDINGTTSTITLGRYTFESAGTDLGKPTLVQSADNYKEVVTAVDYFQELESSSYGNTVAKNLGEFVSKTKASGGYYIARYEASYVDGTKPASKVSTGTPATSSSTTISNGMLWNYMTQPKAATAARAMYEDNNNFVSDLVNSYAWDTAIVFIQEYSGDTDYSQQVSVNSWIANTGTNGDKVCNIHDMASNVCEWTTETSINSGNPCTYRGGFWDGYYTCIRQYHTSTFTQYFGGSSFRSVLYISST